MRQASRQDVYWEHRKKMTMSALTDNLFCGAFLSHVGWHARVCKHRASSTAGQCYAPVIAGCSGCFRLFDFAGPHDVTMLLTGFVAAALPDLFSWLSISCTCMQFLMHSPSLLHLLHANRSRFQGLPSWLALTAGQPLMVLHWSGCDTAVPPYWLRGLSGLHCRQFQI